MSIDDDVKRLREEVDLLITKFLPPIVKRIEALEQVRVNAPVKIGSRQQASYETYEKIKNMTDRGFGIAQIAKELNMPYTSVKNYVNITAERLEKLRQKAGFPPTEIDDIPF